jgi:hypothetical protein
MSSPTPSTKISDAERLLSAFVPRRLALASHIAAITGWNKQKARRLAEDHCEGDQPWLERQPLPAGRGRPWTVYKLTAAGAEAAGRAFHLRLQPSKVSDLVELRHAVCEMDLYTAAWTAGRNAELEKVFPYGEGVNIRADVALEADRKWILFEVEQSANLQNLERILEKLEHYQAFFSSPGSKAVDPVVRILFQIDPQDVLTLQVWAQAWEQIAAREGRLPLSLRWREAGEFLSSPDWDTLEGFQLLPEVRKSEPAPGEPAARDPEQLMQEYIRQTARRTAHTVISRQEMDWVRTASGLFVDALVNMETVAQGSQSSFLDMIDLIYACSHRSGHWGRYTAAMPYASLAALKAYLDRPRQAYLRRELMQALKGLGSAYYRGMVMVQATITHLVWDVFLKHHGLARNGPLTIYASGPDEEDYRSEFHLRVRIAPGSLFGWPGVREGEAAIRFSEDALAWVLEALWLYQKELGLEDKTPRRIRKS